MYIIKTSEHKYYGSLVAAKRGRILPFHTLGRFKGEVWENKEYIVRFGQLVPSRFRSGEERIVESNVESAIVGKTVVSDSTPSQECYKVVNPCEYDCSGLCKESC